MDKSWMNIAHRTSDPRYELGVNEFLDFAYRNKQVSSKVPCLVKTATIIANIVELQYWTI